MRLQNKIHRWRVKTFGANQTISGIDNHLVKEFKEFQEAKTAENQAEEMADILILLMGRADLMGIDLMAEAEKKLIINRRRTWGTPDGQGVIEHIR